MKIDIIAAALPPRLDGIGDYTANIARELARSAQVRILTAQGQNPAPIQNVEVLRAFNIEARSSVHGITQTVKDAGPDWLVLQYNPFSYGKWGFNPALPRAIRNSIRETGTRFALMIHEAYVPVTSWKTGLMTIWQRWQWRSLCRSAEVVFTSVQGYAERVRDAFPKKRVVHLPVGSNVDICPIGRSEARERLGIAEDTVVLGLFGSSHPSRSIEPVRASVDVLTAEGRNAVLLYIGPNEVEIRSELGGRPVLAEGPLPPDEVSRRFAAMDIYLAPFSDGVSTRRTSFMTALQHGRSVVGTDGPLTDSILKSADGSAFLLADSGNSEEFAVLVQRLAASADIRAEFGDRAAVLYAQEFDWPTITTRMINAIRLESEVRPLKNGIENG